VTDRETLDFTDPMQRPGFTGLATFFRLPYSEDFEADPPEIGVCGVPYDGGVTNRPGPRHAPREVRNLSSLMRRVNQASGVNPFAAAEVADIGDAWIRKPYELTGAHKEIEDYFRRVKAAGIRPLSRAHDTALAVAAVLGLEIAVDEGLMECHLGAHQGHPHGPRLREYFAGTYVPPEGEHFDDFCTRTWAAMQRAVARGTNTLTVAHGGLWIAARRYLAVDPDLARMPNALPLHVEPEPGRWRHRIVGALEWGDSPVAV